MASYREIAQAVDETERAVRYDIDGINNELAFLTSGQFVT